MMQRYRHEEVANFPSSVIDSQISEETHEYTLQENEEFRFEVDFGSKVQIQVCATVSVVDLASCCPGQPKFLEQK